MAPQPWKVVAVNTSPGVTYVHEEEILAPLGVTIQQVVAHDPTELAAAAGDADVVFGGYRFSREVIDGLQPCRLIPSGGIGVDHIDVAAATERGILVTNQGETFVDEVANHTWMLLLLVARRGLWLHEMTVTGRWREASGELFPVLRVAMPRVTGQVLGLVSFGRIARAVAKRAQAFGMTCLAYDPYVRPEAFADHGVEACPLDELCRRSDFISSHLPLSDETYHLVGEAQFRQMKPSAIFISIGQGKVVDEAALITALQEKRIAGAGLDVFEQEPIDPNNPLLHMPNVALSPHMASVSDVSAVARHRLVGQQILDVLSGRVPTSVVNPTVLPRWRAKYEQAQV